MSGTNRVKCSVLPLFHENEMSRVFLVDEQVIDDTAFLPGLLDQFAIEWQDDFDGFRLDEILGYDLEPSTIFLL
ncbi:hypothetical protein PY650_07910 [Rhizobium calliandrae]|uniref:Uncharacterized protein n=1 Tax=Rhizobium calliandrae TaxID=1312182 RepID=A0ABT7KC70_9HYPH|nr:hypothetical protein [Rhizobium calliandrae]MDL2405588.1 hypothetical protein [Rhizobium calliandrae]